jgi:LuxR family maltose regulon positive regulatory protein
MDLQRILPIVINAITLSGRDCMLFLDDYHLISAPAIHSAIAYILEHLPENLHIVIGSRSDPPLPLARLRARGQLLEIRTDGLRFRANEATQFLNEIMRLKLSPEEVTTLEERTEGWVAGLQLVALSLSGRADKAQAITSFSGGHRFLVEYLMEEVVNRQPQEVQTFLLSTSILERMCTPLCDALPDATPHSEAILKQLEQANLFVVALDDQGKWFRYHHLFRDFLQTRLNKTQSKQIHALHRAACEWLAAHAYLREAASHAFQTQDWEYAAAFVEQHSFDLIVHSDISTIYEWCSVFPEKVMQRHPMLSLQQCLALAYRLRRQNRARIEARLQQVDQLILTMDDKQQAHGLIDLASVVRTFQAFAPDLAADPQDLLSLTQRMLSNYSDSDAGRFSGLLLAGYAYLALNDANAAGQAFEKARQIALREGFYFGIVESTFHLARLAHSQGQLQRVVEICRQGQADIATMLAHPEQELPAMGCLDICLGCVFLEEDQLDEAEGYLRHGLELMGGGMNPYYLMTAYAALFRLFEIQDRKEEAFKSLDHLEAAWPDIAFCTRGLRVGYLLRSAPEDPRSLAEISAWCQEISSSLEENVSLPGLGPFGGGEAYYLAYLTWIRAQIAFGKAQAVTFYLARQLDLASAAGLANRVIELSLLEAQAWRAEGEGQLALSALERALAVAQPAGYLCIFDQGADLTRMLVEAAQRGIFKEYIERILDAIGIPEVLELERRVAAQTPYGESLSERELEVLHLIAQGATNQEIAKQLVITVGTVKSHINHILGKLNAHNRTEAVAHARGLGLIENLT